MSNNTMHVVSYKRLYSENGAICEDWIFCKNGKHYCLSVPRNGKTNTVWSPLKSCKNACVHLIVIIPDYVVDILGRLRSEIISSEDIKRHNSSVLDRRR